MEGGGWKYRACEDGSMIYVYLTNQTPRSTLGVAANLRAKANIRIGSWQAFTSAVGLPPPEHFRLKGGVLSSQAGLRELSYCLQVLSSKITVVGRDFGTSKITVVACNFGPSKITATKTRGTAKSSRPEVVPAQFFSQATRVKR